MAKVSPFVVAVLSVSLNERQWGGGMWWPEVALALTLGDSVSPLAGAGGRQGAECRIR